MGGDHWLKTTFGGRQPLVEDNLQRKIKLGGTQTLVEDGIRYERKPEMLSAFSTRNRICYRKKMYAA